MKSKLRTGMTTHAGRSLLQEAARFSNEGKAVGEYVKNSWQYTDHDPTVEIFVNHDDKSIRIIPVKDLREVIAYLETLSSTN